VRQADRQTGSSHLFPEGFRHPVDESSDLAELSRVFGVGPDAERRQRHAHHQVTQRGHGADAHEARDHGRHVHDEHDGEQRGGRPRGEEDVLAGVVLAVVGVGRVELRLQLLLVAPAEVLAAHLLHGAELPHRRLPQLAVAALQLRRGIVGFVSAADLRTGTRVSRPGTRSRGRRRPEPAAFTCSMLLVYEFLAPATAARLLASAVA